MVIPVSVQTQFFGQLADVAVIRQLGSRVRFLRYSFIGTTIGTTHAEPPHKSYTGLSDPPATKS